MKRPLFIITLIAYLAILLIDTAQLVGLYRDLVGETLISPWLSLFALNIIVLLLSFHRPEWGRLNPAGVFASIIGILHFIFFNTQFEGTPILQLGFLSQILPAVLFSCFFSYAIYFLADRIASMSEEMSNAEQESRKAFKERMKDWENSVKETEAYVNERLKSMDDKYKDLNNRETVLNDKEKQLNELERAMNKTGEKVKWGRGYLKIAFDRVKMKWKPERVA